MALIEATRGSSARGQFQTLRDSLQNALATNDEATLRQLRENIAHIVSLAAYSREPNEIARVRAQIHRLALRASKLQSDENREAVSKLLGQFEAHDLVLENYKILAQLAFDAEKRSLLKETVRGQVLNALGSTPRRPRDIADEIGCDPTQVSRALKELGGLVRRSTAPLGHDGRAHWYVLASSAESEG